MEHITDPFELQSRLIYSIVVAGKSAKFANGVMDRWLARCTKTELPFDMARRVRDNGSLEATFRDARSGNYSKLTKAVSEIIDSKVDLLTCTPQDLEEFHGVGPKTSRFFILWTRPDAIYAALDVHVLRWLRKQGYDAPKSTPQSGKAYAKLEEIFLQEAKKQGKTPRELDYEIWSKASTALNVV